MSDFGTLLTVFRADRADITDGDKKHVGAAVEKVSSGPDEWSDALGEPFSFRIGAAMRPVSESSSKHQHGLSVCLSEYWAPMLDDLEDTADELLALDKETARAVLDCLEGDLRALDLQVELVAGDW